VNNQAVATTLDQIAQQYKLAGDKWRAIAFEKASHSVRACRRPLADIDISSLKDVGHSIQVEIEEMLKTGSCSRIKALKVTGPPVSLIELEQLMEVGPKTALRLWKEYGVDSISKLEKKSKVLAKKEPSIVEALKAYKKIKKRIPLFLAMPAVQEVCNILLSSGLVLRAEPAGSVRRNKHMVRDLDILTSVSDSKVGKFLRWIRSNKNLKVIAGGGKKVTFETFVAGEPRRGDIIITKPKSWGNALNYLTGSKSFNIAIRSLALKKGLTVNEKATRYKDSEKSLPSFHEKDLFNALKVPFVPPECRIDGSELGKSFEDLVTLKSICGDVHIHTVNSDGLLTIKNLERTAKSAGLAFIGISEHSPALGIANGIKAKDAKRLKSLLPKNFPIYFGSEVDVKVDGSLAYTTKELEIFDYVILSLHLSPGKNTSERVKAAVLAAASRPTIIGHLTGRRNGREAAEEDWPQLFDFLAKKNVVLEINSQPDRMDPPAELIRMAKSKGIKFSINSDCHDKFIDLKWGIVQARKGLLTPKDCINSSHRSFERWLGNWK
jgi:DNA polymerase (family 10)